MRLSARILVGGLLAALPAVPSQSQKLAAQSPVGLPASREAQPGNGDIEVLTRGPVHEAFASTAEQPAAGPIVQRMPPNPIEELPPDQKPDGDNVQWIPGYWAYDEERTDFIWISGFWRVPPPGRAWIAGSWREVAGGRQWVHGFWQLVVQQQQQQLEYLPPPPVPLDFAPSIPQPTVTSYYVPGTWVHRGRYFWRPGYWMEHRPGWVWVPSHYRYTPGGYLFIDGYWDYPVAERGILFAPVYFAPVIVNRPAYVYTPVYVVPTQAMFGALFIRQGVSNYYFGDYFEPRYTTIGFSAWNGSGRGSSFALSVTVGRGVHYDPLWSYYQAGYRNNPVFVNQINEVYVGRYNNVIARPPRTLIQQNTVVNNITNVTNNVTNVTNNVTNVTNNNRIVNPAPVPAAAQNLMMVQPLKTLPQSNTAVTLKAVPKEEQVREQQLSRQLREVGTQRNKAETQIADRQLTPTTQNDKPRQVALDVPKQVVARAQAPAEPRKVLPPTPPQQQPQQPSLTATKPAVPAPAPVPPVTANPMNPTKPSTTTVPTPEPGKVSSKPLPAPTPVNPPAPAPIGNKPLPGPTPVPVPNKPLPGPTLAPAPIGNKPLPMPQPPKIGAPPAQVPTPVPVPAKPMPVVPVMPPKQAEAPRQAPAPVPMKPLPAPAPVVPVMPAKPPAPAPIPVQPSAPAPQQLPSQVGKPGGAPLPNIPQAPRAPAPTPPAKEPKKPEKPNG